MGYSGGGMPLGVTNTAKRIPVVLVLDCSGSMNGEPITDLNAGLDVFFNELQADKELKEQVELAIISFNSSATIEAQFDEIQNIQKPDLKAGGSTSMGAAVTLALDMLEGRKQEYKKAGVEYFQPIMLLMTDGRANDDISDACARSSRELTNKKLTVLPLAFGNGVDESKLSSFAPAQTILRVGPNFKFKEFFRMLSESMSMVANGVVDVAATLKR